MHTNTPAKVTGTPIMLALLASAYCLAFVDRLMMAVVAEPVKMEFDLSDTQLFLLTGSFFILTYGFMGMLTGWLLDKWNRMKLVAGSVAIWSFFTVICGFAGSFPQLALARAAVGASESTIVPAALSMISDSYPLRKRPLAIGIFYAGGMLGVLLAWTVGGWITAEYGWRAAFLVAGPPGLLIAILILWKGRDPRREPAEPVAAVRGSTFGEVWRNKPLIWLIAAGAMLTFVNIGLINQMGSFFIRSHGMTIREVGLIFGPVMACGMALGLIGGGIIGNYLASKGTKVMLRFVIWNSFLLFPIYLVILLVPSKELALAATFVGTFASVLYSPCFSAAYQAVSAPHTRATAAGISNCASAVLGGALTTVLVGALSDYWKPMFGSDSLRYAMIVGLGTCILSGFVFIRALRMISETEPELTRS